MKRFAGLARVGKPLFFWCFLFLAAAGSAQDQRSVTSPDGQVEFRVFYAQPEPGALFQLAYQVFFHGKQLLDTSFMGLDIQNQEPILGANLGLTSSKTGAGDGFHSLVAEYMQNGSLGRRLNLEVRAFNDSVAFRYIVPKSTPLDEILLQDEYTEFSFVTAQAGESVRVTEVPAPGYPAMSLVRTEPKTLQTHLARLASDASLAFRGNTPLITSWRVIHVGPDGTDPQRFLKP